jgi:hypothetical protein
MNLTPLEIITVIACVIGFIGGCFAIRLIWLECDDDDYVLP